MSLDPEIAQKREVLSTRTVDGQVLKRLVEAGLIWLRTNQEVVNALNVFPVPDGDTGTNMVLTMQAAFDEISQSNEHNFGKMAHAAAHGALMGARGNSGVILSQIWRGFARAVDEHTEVDPETFVAAMAEARDTAYKGVVRPVEGTILTVIKDIAQDLQASYTDEDNTLVLLDRSVISASESVERTPELLNVLREAGVVDAGGKGLFYILEGMLRHIDGLPLDTAPVVIKPLSDLILDQALESIEPGQDWEVICDFTTPEPMDLIKFYEDLEEMGTSIQFGEGDGIYRLHIHIPVEKFYEPEDYIRSLGTITKVAKENLLAQMEDNQQNPCGSGQFELLPHTPGDIAVVAVAPGVGFSRIFASMGAAAIIEGGQTMNPSTEEIFNAFESLPTEHVIILPNNKNIFLAATNAADLTAKKVSVIPSRTIPQGLSAMMRLIPDGDFEDIVKEMNNALLEVETGEITTSTRDVEIDGVSTKKGEIISLLNGKIVAASKDLETACTSLFNIAHADHFELITLYYGEMMPTAEVFRIEDVIRSKYPDLEIEVHPGCQPHYHFIISIE